MTKKCLLAFLPTFLLVASLLTTTLPVHAQSAFSQGMDYFNEGKLDEAVAAYKQAIALTPQNADIHFALGMAYDDQGKPDEAIAAFRQVIILTPQDANAPFLMGTIYNKQGKRAEAAAAYKQSGNIFYQQNALDNAMTAFEKALALDPQDPEPHYNMGLILKARKDYRAALEHFKTTGELHYFADYIEAEIEACEKALATPQP